MSHQAAVNTILQARANRQQAERLPEPYPAAALATAYAVQEEVTAQLLAQLGGQRIGYKIACTNEAAQKFLKLDSPFHGPLLSALTYQSPVQLPADSFFMRVIEPEFAFELAADLPPVSMPYTQDQVAEAIGAIIPCIEIVDSRYTDWTSAGAPSLIADSAVHGAWVHGERHPEWRVLDLATHEIKLMVNGELNQVGSGAAVLGHPLTAMTWLANALSEAGSGLQAGDVVTTGVCVDEVYYAASTDEIIADFGSLGQVTVIFEDA